MPYYAAIVSLLTVAFHFFLATRVAAAHGKFNVKLPATTGNADFERVFRVHMNTLEWMPTFLLPLWLCAIYLNDIAAAMLGLVWIGGRVLYFTGYIKSCGEASARVLHPIDGMRLAVRRRRYRHRPARDKRLIGVDGGIAVTVHSTRQLDYVNRRPGRSWWR